MGELTDQVAMDITVLGRFLADSYKLNVGQLRKIIHAMNLNTVKSLAFLGYDLKVIQNNMEN